MAQGPQKRRRRERAEIDRLVFDAVRAILVRDGVLQGFTLQTVADEAGVNRVQLYQNFGSKQELLRATIMDLLEQMRKERTAYRERPFAERRRLVFEQFLMSSDVVRLEALLAQHGDQEFQVFPEMSLTLEALDRDVRQGDLPADADGVALHILTAATYMGHCIFRDVYARDTGIDVQDLDARVLRAFSAVFAAYVDSGRPEWHASSDD